MDKITVEAKLENMYQIIDFVEDELFSMKVPEAEIVTMSIAVEEIFVNITSYAYGDDTGSVTIEVDKNDSALRICFIDSGEPYNPLEKADPDISLPPEQRDIGGLGIFMMKNMVDSAEYKYENGQNNLTIIKNF